AAGSATRRSSSDSQIQVTNATTTRTSTRLTRSPIESSHGERNQPATTSGGGLDARRNERRLERDRGRRRRALGSEAAYERKGDERGWCGGDPRRQLHGGMRRAVRLLAPGMRPDVTRGEHETCRQRKNECQRKNHDAPRRHSGQCSTGRRRGSHRLTASATNPAKAATLTNRRTR